jgi:RNase H-fold protein (predicted Holliday junction resolvase)
VREELGFFFGTSSSLSSSLLALPFTPDSRTSLLQYKVEATQRRIRERSLLATFLVDEHLLPILINQGL